MTDISFKNRIIAFISYSFAAFVLTVRSALTFSFVFWLCMGLVIFFADKILNDEKIKNRTVFTFFIFAICYQTFFQVFIRVHINNVQLMTASALAIFLAGIFASTNRKNLSYSLFSAVLICFLDIRVAAPYCIFLLSSSIVKLQLESEEYKLKKDNKRKKNNKRKNNKKIPTRNHFRVTIIFSIICLVFCLNSVFKNEIRMTEDLDYVLKQFKGFFGFSILIVYLLIKLMRSEIKAKISIALGLVIHIVFIPIYHINYGWSISALFIVSITMFLIITCLEKSDIINSIKEDFYNHKYIFFVEILLLLQ